MATGTPNGEGAGLGAGGAGGVMAAAGGLGAGGIPGTGLGACRNACNSENKDTLKSYIAFWVLFVVTNFSFPAASWAQNHFSLFVLETQEDPDRTSARFLSSRRWRWGGGAMCPSVLTPGPREALAHRPRACGGHGALGSTCGIRWFLTIQFHTFFHFILIPICWFWRQFAWLRPCHRSGAREIQLPRHPV